MTNVLNMGSVASIVTGTIGTNGTLSEEFDLSAYTVLGLMIDNASNGTLNFLVNWQPGTVNDPDTYRLLRATDGSAVAYTLPAGNVAYKEIDIKVLSPYRYVKLLTSVAQGSAPTVRFIVKG